MDSPIAGEGCLFVLLGPILEVQLAPFSAANVVLCVTNASTSGRPAVFPNLGIFTSLYYLRLFLKQG